MDAAAENMFVPCSSLGARPDRLAGNTLTDFEVQRKIAGKDIRPGGLQQTITQHGVSKHFLDRHCWAPLVHTEVAIRGVDLIGDTIPAVGDTCA
eukprot:COSAG01_NODE_1434_length_10317_cov_4.131924_1_plen_94_part_00